MPNPSENYRVIWTELFSDNSLSPEEKGFMIGLYCICVNNTFRLNLPDKAIYETLGMVKNTYTKYKNSLISKGILKTLGESYIALINFNFFHGTILMYPHLGYVTYLDILENNVPEEDVNGNLAVSNIRKLECSSFDFHSIAYGYGTFKEKIHFTEYYP